MRSAWRWLQVVVVVCVAFGAVGARAAGAQDAAAPRPDAVEVKAAAPTAAAVPAEKMSWGQIIKSGGWLMYVLAAMSVLTVAFVIYFFAVLRVGQVAPRSLHRDLVEKIRGGAIEDARRACEYRPCPLSAVALAAIDYMRDVAAGDSSMLRDVIEGEGSRQAEAIHGQTQYLLDVAVVAPMVGLLGTVFGMLHAFSGIALNIASAKPVVLAEGISQALITTAFGLMIGIPAMMFYAYFRRKASALVSYLEAVSTEILTALLSKRS
jgi:biopolymer transport protein ExbB